MKLDPACWAEDNLPGAVRRGASYKADCPICGKKGHLYVHAEEGFWTCFAGECGESGSSLVKLISAVEGITISEANQRLFREHVRFERRVAEPSTQNQRLRLLKTKTIMHDLVDVPPPPGMIPIWDGKAWRMPKYLLERGISRRQARKFGLGFCREQLCDQAPVGCEFPEGTPSCVERGRCRYGNRIIFPYECPNGRSFTARTIGDVEPKYLNPPDKRSRLLYGWQLVALNSDIVIVEGPTDVIRLDKHGLRAVAPFGLRLSAAQRNLLQQASVATITVMQDAGVETNALKIASEVSGLAEDVFVAKLPQGIDPGDSTREIAWKAYREADKYTAGFVTRGVSFLGLQSRVKEKFTF
jgi:DNA primase